MASALEQAKGEPAKRINQAYRYLYENRSGLEDYRSKLGENGKDLRRTGAMEGNIDKLVVRRMKNQGMSWTIKGIRRLLCIRFLVLEGKLKDWLVEKPYAHQINIPKKKIRRTINHLSAREPDAWLEAGIPALAGPHASHPWVQLLKSLSEVRSI